METTLETCSQTTSPSRIPSTTDSLPVANSRSSIPSDHEMMVYHTMAEQAVSSKMYRGIGEKAGVMMIMLAARELGIPPMQALNGGINIIQGKVEISARMMSALIRKSGHQISIKENGHTSCTLVGKRTDTGEILEVSYTLDEAQKAGLVKAGGGWTKCPKDMCFARALSRLARQLFSDVIGIGYIEGEIKAVEAEIVIPRDDFPELDVIVEEDRLSELLDLFDKEDRFHVLEYLKIVQKHFDWTQPRAIKELLKDPKRLFEKFHVWKNKSIKTEEACAS